MMRLPADARVRAFVALVAGATWPLAFAPVGAWPVAIASLAVLFLAVSDAAARRAALVAGAWGLGCFGAGVWWVYISVNHFGGLHWSLSTAITVLLMVVLAAFVAAFGWISARWAPRAGAVRWLVALPAAWVAVEWLRSWFLTGFPWLLAGYAVDGTWAVGYAPVFGVLAPSFVVALGAGAVAWLATARAWRPAAVAAGVCALVWAGGAVLARVDWTASAGDPISVAALQGNVGQDVKWEPSYLLPTIDIYQGLTEGHWDADLIVWPEAALPALKHQLQPYLNELAARADAHDTDIMMGILVRDGDDYYNSVVTLGDDRVYAKRKLVPFGEFFPVPDFVREWLRLLNLPYSDFTRGARDQLPLSAAGHAIAASICYEAAYGSDLIRSLPAAELLVNVSNDAWFGDTVAPHQHLQIVRMRAREAGRWLVRATNSGITAVIAPDGRVVDSLPQFERGVLRAEVVPLAGATPYARWRNWPVVSLVLVMLGVAARLRYA